MSLMTKIASLIKFVLPTASMQDSRQFSTQRVSYMGKENDVTVISPYGLYSSAPAGKCLGVTWLIQGQEQNRVGMFTNYDERNAIFDRETPLKSGEVELLNTESRARMKFLEDGSILIEMEVPDTDTRSNIELKSNGEIIARNGVSGDSIDIKNDGTIIVDTPRAIFTGDIDVLGDIRPKDSSAQDIRDIFDNHVHSGVQTGASNTNVPTTGQ